MIYKLMFLIYRIANKISQFFYFLTIKFQPHDVQQNNIINSTNYNMMTESNEPYYAEQYNRIILPHINSINKNATILDLGCGQGRLTINLAEKCPQARIIGCDISEYAIKQARQYSAEKSQNNIDWRVQSIEECLAGFKENSVDVALMTEVTFYFSEWQKSLKNYSNHKR